MHNDSLAQVSAWIAVRMHKFMMKWNFANSKFIVIILQLILPVGVLWGRFPKNLKFNDMESKVVRHTMKTAIQMFFSLRHPDKYSAGKKSAWLAAYTQKLHDEMELCKSKFIVANCHRWHISGVDFTCGCVVKSPLMRDIMIRKTVIREPMTQETMIQ